MVQVPDLECCSPQKGGDARMCRPSDCVLPARGAAGLLAHFPELAVIVADWRGTIRWASAASRALLPELAIAGSAILPVLRAVGLQPMDLLSATPATAVGPVGPQQQQHLCHLMPQSASKRHSWLVVLQPLPETVFSAAGRGISEIAASAAHEIRNPLTTVRSILDELRMAPQELNPQHLDVALRELDRINDMLTGFMALGTTYARAQEKIDLRAAAEEAAVASEAMLTVRGQHLELALPPQSISVNAASTPLHLVLLNVIRNASEAAPKGSCIRLEGMRERDLCCLRVLDEGSGFPDDVISHVFKPFFTTKPMGTGLGLAFCRRVITTFGGNIVAYNHEGGGGAILISLPSTGV